MVMRCSFARTWASLLLPLATLRRSSALSLVNKDPLSLMALSSSSEEADQARVNDTKRAGHKLVSFKLPCSSSSGGVWVILYQTSMALAPLGGFLYSQLAEQMDGLMLPEVIGMGTHFGGFSSKHHLAIQRLSAMDADDLVILSDYADVVLNPGRGQPGTAFCGFRDEYRKLVANRSKDAVVMSAEAQCCVGALSYAQPGAFIGLNKSKAVRKSRACNSGASGCMGLGADRSWRDFMENEAAKNGYNNTQYPYLNAGLMAGRAGALASMLSEIQLDAEEDDQAVMTDMMVAFPERFVLDYDQKLFGNARWPKQSAGCIFKMDQTGFFQQTETGTHPLFLHTSGKFYKCLRSLASQVGWTAPGSSAARGQLGLHSLTAAALTAVAALLFAS